MADDYSDDFDDDDYNEDTFETSDVEPDFIPKVDSAYDSPPELTLSFKKEKSKLGTGNEKFGAPLTSSDKFGSGMDFGDLHRKLSQLAVVQNSVGSEGPQTAELSANRIDRTRNMSSLSINSLDFGSLQKKLSVLVIQQSVGSVGSGQNLSTKSSTRVSPKRSAATSGFSTAAPTSGQLSPMRVFTRQGSSGSSGFSSAAPEPASAFLSRDRTPLETIQASPEAADLDAAPRISEVSGFSSASPEPDNSAYTDKFDSFDDGPGARALTQGSSSSASPSQSRRGSINDTGIGTVDLSKLLKSDCNLSLDARVPSFPTISDEQARPANDELKWLERNSSSENSQCSALTAKSGTKGNTQDRPCVKFFGSSLQINQSASSESLGLNPPANIQPTVIASPKRMSEHGEESLKSFASAQDSVDSRSQHSENVALGNNACSDTQNKSVLCDHEEHSSPVFLCKPIENELQCTYPPQIKQSETPKSTTENSIQSIAESSSRASLVEKEGQHQLPPFVPAVTPNTSVLNLPRPPRTEIVISRLSMFSNPHLSRNKEESSKQPRAPVQSREIKVERKIQKIALGCSLGQFVKESKRIENKADTCSQFTGKRYDETCAVSMDTMVQTVQTEHKRKAPKILKARSSQSTTPTNNINAVATPAKRRETLSDVPYRKNSTLYGKKNNGQTGPGQCSLCQFQNTVCRCKHNRDSFEVTSDTPPLLKKTGHLDTDFFISNFLATKNDEDVHGPFFSQLYLSLLNALSDVMLQKDYFENKLSDNSAFSEESAMHMKSAICLSLIETLTHHKIVRVIKKSTLKKYKEMKGSNT